MCWLFKGWVSQEQIVLGLQIFHSSGCGHQQRLWWNNLVLITGRVKEQIMVWGAGPLPCAAGIFCPREVFFQRGLSEPLGEPEEGVKLEKMGSWTARSAWKAVSDIPQFLFQRADALSGELELAFRSAFTGCSPLLCSPSRCLDGLRHRTCLNSLYYLLLFSKFPSVWWASLFGVPHSEPCQ